MRLFNTFNELQRDFDSRSEDDLYSLSSEQDVFDYYKEMYGDTMTDKQILEKIKQEREEAEDSLLEYQLDELIF